MTIPALSSQLGDLFSHPITISSSTRCLPPTALPIFVERSLAILPDPTVTSILPSIVEQALSSFAALIQSLSTGVNQVEEVQQRLLSLVHTVEACIERDDPSQISQKAMEGLTRIIAEVGVSELVGVEVEGAVLSLLEGFELIYE